MQDGKQPTQRLSARLNEDLEQIRAENAALMASQLESFRNDLHAIAINALTTIEADTKKFESWNAMLWRDHRQTITQAIWFRRWTLLAGMLLLTVTLGCVTWVWSAVIAQMHQRATLQAVGMQVARDPNGTYLIPDLARITVTKCNLEGRDAPCFRVEN